MRFLIKFNLKKKKQTYFNARSKATVEREQFYHSSILSKFYTTMTSITLKIIKTAIQNTTFLLFLNNKNELITRFTFSRK